MKVVNNISNNKPHSCFKARLLTPEQMNEFSPSIKKYAKSLKDYPWMMSNNYFFSPKTIEGFYKHVEPYESKEEILDRIILNGEESKIIDQFVQKAKQDFNPKKVPGAESTLSAFQVFVEKTGLKDFMDNMFQNIKPLNDPELKNLRTWKSEAEAQEAKTAASLNRIFN